MCDDSNFLGLWYGVAVDKERFTISVNISMSKTKTFIYLTHFLFITIYVENDFCVH